MSWKKVIHAYELDQDGNCPVCNVDYADCECPGPTQDDEYDYKVENNELFAKLKEI